MSCLNLGKRFLPARKAWRSFTTKLQTKLHKLHNSKSSIKKKTHQNRLIRLSTATAVPLLCPSLSLSFQPRLRHKKLLIQRRKAAVSVGYRRSHVVQKRAAPVYVDELFNEPITKTEAQVERLAGGSTKRMKVVTDQQQPAMVAAVAVAAESGQEGGKSCCGSDQKTRGAADEMWESVGLASPLMYGIDERAEEFIARFRADLARGV